MRLYNTLTRKKEKFLPIVPGEIRMYACGPTVYNYFHIGNARTFMVFDAMREYFKYRGYKVTFVQNFTDIDDKIINKAREEGVSSKEISEKYIDEYFKDARSLGIKDADIHPRVTDNVEDIVAFIQGLIDRGFAYETLGDVYFDVSKFKAYGKLKNQSPEELQVGARVEINEQKRNPLDFVLWKGAKPGEPSWESPWGLGRPGWHIECSAMAQKFLGETIDIHGGGGDLVFPHHENEIAQSEAFSGKPFANYWLHVGYLNIDNKKMSKSLDNFFTPREIAKEFDLESLRFFMFSAHYRNPINFSKEALISADNALQRLYNAKNNLLHLLKNTSEKSLGQEEIQFENHLLNYKKKFIEVMDDDFNTSDGIATIFDLVKDINSNISINNSSLLIQKALDLLLELAGVLGFLYREKEEILDEEIENLIQKRQEARREKDYGLADKIRDQLKEMNIILEDTPQGVKWKRN